MLKRNRTRIPKIEIIKAFTSLPRAAKRSKINSRTDEEAARTARTVDTPHEQKATSSKTGDTDARKKEMRQKENLGKNRKKGETVRDGEQEMAKKTRALSTKKKIGLVRTEDRVRDVMHKAEQNLSNHGFEMTRLVSLRMMEEVTQNSKNGKGTETGIAQVVQKLIRSGWIRQRWKSQLKHIPRKTFNAGKHV
jgi:hypothetical protein